LGIPTVTIVTTEFVSLAKNTALSQGVADMSLVVYPHPVGMIPLEEIRKKATDAFPELMKAATQWKSTAKLAAMKSPYPAERFKFSGTPEDVTRFFYDKRWSMGLPIVPPTSQRVVAMLKGTKRKPDEVIGLVPPRMGVLTVEMAAVHCAMADCKPEYMPVLLAAMEAALAPETNWRGAGTTTGTTSLLTIINGPIVKEIGLASDTGAAGKGHHANAAIGYAMNSILYTIGGSKPPETDKGTLAAPSDFTGWIFAENEDALPKGWTPFHVDRGFKKTDSVVTVQGIYPAVSNHDHASNTIPKQLKYWGNIISPLLSANDTCVPAASAVPSIIAIGPEHAQLLTSGGWNKQEVTKALWESIHLPLSSWPTGCTTENLEKGLGQKITPDTQIHLTKTPDTLWLMIAGGPGKHSHYFPPFLGCNPVSRLIKD
jgi:hypothetical protein